MTYVYLSVELIIIFLMLFVSSVDLDALYKRINASNPRFRSDTDTVHDGLHLADISPYPARARNHTAPFLYSEEQMRRIEPVKSSYRGDGIVKEYTDAVVYRGGRYYTFVKSPDTYLVLSRCSAHEKEKVPLKKRLLPPIDSIEIFIDRAVLVSSADYHPVFYHMVSERVFPLGSLRAIFKKYPGITIIVDYLSQGLIQYAQLLGIDTNSIINIGEVNDQNVVSKSVYVGTLYLPVGIGCGHISRGHVAAFQSWVRDEHKDLYKAKDRTSIGVIHRFENENTNYRFNNHDELMTALRTEWPHINIYDFIAGHHSIEEVMRMLSDTHLLIAPHGSGLVHMLLLPEGARVLEIFHRGVPNWCFGNLAISGNYPYYCTIGEENFAYVHLVVAGVKALYNLTFS
jgi:Glycosyltransferase 61